jgi:epoxyqueuosine reductase QueG
MEQRLRDMGYAAVAPAVVPENQLVQSPAVGLSSHWSERHAAFVAGLGTFGLSGGLITERGIAHRLGSVVTDAAISPTARPYGDDPFAWCLRKNDSTCGVCMARCPAGSIGATLHDRDKEACRSHAYNHISTIGQAKFGWTGVYGCGLCQTAVPCEHRNPTRPRQD